MNKTITMPYDEYQLLISDNEQLKRRFDERLEESAVYLTLVDTKKYPWDTHKMTGQIVKKDGLLSKMQEHLDEVAKRGKEREAEFEKRIKELEEKLQQASIIKEPAKAVSSWWHKLFSNGN
jgi:predicted GTPase